MEREVKYLASYNVLKEPWIAVRTTYGGLTSMGILDVLKNAHTLESIDEISPLTEYGIYRLLIAFLMDALRPQTIKDIESLADKGTFDMGRINVYIEGCEEEGPCFDLFDKQRPFLQSAYNEKWDSRKQIKSVEALLHQLPSGNNAVHFNHLPENGHCLSEAVCVKALTAVNVFCTAGLQGPSSINGAPPVFVLVQGRTLFEKLLYNMIPFESTDIPIDTPPIAWRNREAVTPGKKVERTSLLYGLTWQARRITLIPEDTPQYCTFTGEYSKNPVKRIYLQKGEDFCGYADWTDPHIPYMISEHGKNSLKPRLGKDTWRSIPFIVSNDAGAPSVVKNRALMRDCLKHITVTAYSLCTDRASYEAWQKEIFTMDAQIMEDRRKAAAVFLALEAAKDVSEILRRELYRITAYGKTLPQTQTIDEAERAYFAGVRKMFFGKFLQCLERAETDIKRAALVAEWKENLVKAAINEYESFSDRLGLGGDFLLKSALAAKSLRFILKNYLLRGKGGA